MRGGRENGGSAVDCLIYMLSICSRLKQREVADHCLSNDEATQLVGPCGGLSVGSLYGHQGVTVVFFTALKYFEMN